MESLELSEDLQAVAQTINRLKPDMRDILRKSGLGELVSSQAFDAVATATSIHNEFVHLMLMATLGSVDTLLDVRNKRFEDAFMKNMDRIFEFVRGRMEEFLAVTQDTRREIVGLKEELGLQDETYRQLLEKMNKQIDELDTEIEQTQRALREALQEEDPEWTQLMEELNVKESG